MLDNGMIDENTVVGFANTGKEHEKTLEFVRNIELNWNIKVWWVEYISAPPPI